MTGTPPRSPALRFAQVARQLGAAARATGLAVPAFRSPPRVAGAARTIRRYPGGAVVSVRLRGRPFERVTSDMIEGVLVANQMHGDAAAQLRRRLLAALDDASPAPSEPPAAPVSEPQTQTQAA